MKNVFEERVQINLARVPTWQRKTLGDYFDYFVQMYGSRDYIVTGDKTYSYRQTAEQVNRLAKGLMNLGLKKREHVAMVMANYPEAVFIKFAVAKIGCVNVPLNYRMLAEELQYVLHQSDTVCLIIMDELGSLNYIEILKQLCPEIFAGQASPAFPYLREIVVFSPQGKKYQGTTDFYDLLASGKEVADWQLEELQKTVCYPDEVADILYTSGTTGHPKGVMLTHDMLWRKSYCSILGRAMEEGRRILIPLPLYHVFGYVEGLLAAQFVGGAVIPQVTWNPQETLQLIERRQANDILCVPTMGLDLVNQPDLQKYDLTSLKAMYCAGAPAPVSLWQRLFTELGLEYLNTGYGMTEVSSAPLQSKYDASMEKIASRVGRIIPGGAAGQPEYGGRCIEYKTIDPFSGEDLPPGAEGEWVCRGNVVTRGYYKKPLETAEVLDKDGWLRTGDIGIIHGDGILEITGRSKELYKIGGENVAPKEIEEVISRHEKVNQVYVIGVPNEKMGEVGMAFVELKTGQQSSAEEILQYCSDKLARFKIPKYVVFLQEEELPKTTTGKVQKFMLKERAQKVLQNMQRSV